LRALELARKENPDDAAVRFVLGFQYLYLGYPQQAQKQLNAAAELAPEDLFARDLAAIAAAAGGAPGSEALPTAELAAEEPDSEAVPAETPTTSP
jgi:predicted Zn-dependent protease